MDMHIRAFVRPAAAAALILAGAGSAQAQTWRGFYVGGQVGGGLLPDGAGKFVGFDKNLDGVFTDTVTTVAGANAFSPGFCSGASVTVTPAGGCVQDDNAVGGGLRLGYDGQAGHFVFGTTGEISWLSLADSVTAFSTTPASYTFTRELNSLATLGLRAGYGTSRLLVYGTGAFARGDLDRTFATSNRVNTFVPTEQEDVWGWQVGGGVEYRVGAGVRLGAQYQWTTLDDETRYTVRSQGPAPATNPFLLTNPAGTDLRRSDDFEFSTVRFTASYRF
jgi:opacity protein-like surface antigen